MAFASINQASVGGGSSNALAIQSDGIFMPRLSTGQRTALALTTGDTGLTVYDFTLKNLFIWNGTAWESIPSSGDAGVNGAVQYNDNGIVSGASNFVYDKVNNRVGIGTASPNDTLTIASDNYLSFQTAVTTLNSGRAARIGAISSGTGNGFLSFETYQGGSGGGERYRLASDGVATWSNVGGVAGTAMTLNATGLGVGMSPVSAFNVGATGGNDGDLYFNTLIRNTGTAATSQPRTGILFSGYYIGSTNFSNFAGITGGKENATSGNSAGFISLCTAANGGSPTARLTVDSSGNVGIGVTPSTGGSISNASIILAGIFSTLIKSLSSIATATPTTIFAAPSESTLMVTAFVAGAAPSDYKVVAVVKVSGGVVAITAISSATSLTITASGTNIQVTQTSGGPQNIGFSVLRLN